MYTFGFGCNHCASLLEAISTQGGGVYYFVDSSDKVCDLNMGFTNLNYSPSCFLRSQSALQTVLVGC